MKAPTQLLACPPSAAACRPLSLLATIGQSPLKKKLPESLTTGTVVVLKCSALTVALVYTAASHSTVIVPEYRVPDFIFATLSAGISKCSVDAPLPAF